MIDISIIDSLKELRRRYLGEHPDALKQIDEWEKKVQELSRIDDFVNQQTTQAIVEALKQRLFTIRKDRALKKGHTPESLKTLDDREGELQYVLKLFMPDYETELASLEQIIQSEL